MNGGRCRCVLMMGNEKLRIVRLAIINPVNMAKQHLQGNLGGSSSKRVPLSRFQIEGSLGKGCLFLICFVLVVLKVFESLVPNLNCYFLGFGANLHKMSYIFLASGRMTQVGVSLCKGEWKETKAGLLQVATTNQNCPQSCCSHRAV